MSVGKSSINRAGKAAVKITEAPANEETRFFAGNESRPSVVADDVKLEFVAIGDILPTYDENMITCGATFDEVVASVKKYGILIPMLLRRLDTENGPVYRIMSGHKRFYAAQKLGLKTVPAEIISCDDKTAAEIYNETVRYDSKSKIYDETPSRIVTSAVLRESDSLPMYLL